MGMKPIVSGSVKGRLSPKAKAALAALATGSAGYGASKIDKETRDEIKRVLFPDISVGDATKGDER